MQNKDLLIQTLCYFDIFSFPLKLSEIQKYFVGKKVKKSELLYLIRECPNIQTKDGYYFLSGREQLVPMRKIRKEFSSEKKRYAKNTIRILSKIPTIKAISLSGSVSCGNAKMEDDIDLFIITSKNAVWLSRLIVFGVLKLLGRLRRESKINNAFCPNMFVSQGNLLIEEQNIYTASEILHLIPLYQVNNSFNNFINANRWVYRYFPNSIGNQDSSKSHMNSSVFPSPFAKILLPFEALSFLIQFQFMAKKITKEQVFLTRIEFHPQKLSDRIISLWESRYQSVLASNEYKMQSKREYYLV